MTTTAFSYIRFSTPEQSEGDSLRRQTEAATAWCGKNDIHLDTTTTLRDLGKSAYLGEHRKNPDRYALAAFLKLVESGKVPKGSYLVIENLDRLSREHSRPALSLFMQILDAGINIVQLSPETVFRHDSTDPFDLMRAILELSRGHSESKMKSERVGKAWEQKKLRTRTNGELYTRRLPGWMEERGRKLRLIPAHVRAIKRIFQLAAAGYGIVRTVRKLTEEEVRPFGTSGQWNRAYVSLIHQDRRVLGEFQPRRPDGSPDGEVIQGYYPAAVSEAEWNAAHTEPRSPLRIRRGKHLELFNGLLWNARDGGRYYCSTRNNRGKRHRVLVNASATEGRGECYSFPLHPFEQAILRGLAEVSPKEIVGRNTDNPDEVLVLSGEMAGVESKIADMEIELLNGDVPSLARVLRQLEERKKELAGKLTEARQREANPMSEAWGEAGHLCAALEQAPDKEDARLRLRAVLHRIVESIWLLVVNRGTDRLCAVQVYFANSQGRSTSPVLGGRFRDYDIMYRPPRNNRHGKRSPGMIWVEPMRYFADGETVDYRTKDGAEWAIEHLLGWRPDREGYEGRFLYRGTIV